MTSLEKEDIKNTAELPLHWDLLTGRHILISGGTGFIGSFLCNVFRYRNLHYHQNIRVISVAHSRLENDDTVQYISHDICTPIEMDENIDYILHLASHTHPDQYKKDPVGTITGNVFGTYRLLSLAKEKKAKRFVLASSCEIYGDGRDGLMDEMYCGYINSNTARAGYNESKRVSESLCQSFFQQYGVESCVFRLARVFGADRTKRDSKAMAEFLRNAVEGKNIVLKSRGMQKYSYVYISDAAAGILTVLLEGRPGEAYNIASDYDGLSLGQYAEYIASLGGTEVVYEIENNSSASHAQNALLDNAKIKGIGFCPVYSVKDGLKRTLDIYREML